jgi:hypothetical protein
MSRRRAVGDRTTAYIPRSKPGHCRLKAYFQNPGESLAVNDCEPGTIGERTCAQARLAMPKICLDGAGMRVVLVH